jgi:hypothetical protein
MGNDENEPNNCARSRPQKNAPPDCAPACLHGRGVFIIFVEKRTIKMKSTIFLCPYPSKINFLQDTFSAVWNFGCPRQFSSVICFPDERRPLLFYPLPFVGEGEKHPEPVWAIFNISGMLNAIFRDVKYFMKCFMKYFTPNGCNFCT